MATPLSNPNLTPAHKPPLGVSSNLVDPPSNGFIIVIVMVIVISISTPFVLLRIYTRQFINRKLWWDDYTCVAGWAFLVVLAGLLLKALDYGGGVDIWNVSKTQHNQFTKLFHDIEIVARIGMFFTKVSIVLLYHRIFVPLGSAKTGIFWAIWFVFWWNLLYAVALVLTVATECVGKADKVARGEECVNQYAVLICASVINVVSDLMILVIPIVAIKGLHMAPQKKLRLSAVFGVGSLGVMASVARLGYQIPEAKHTNQSQIIMILSSLNVAEQMIGIVVACMPVLPAFLRHITSRSSLSKTAGSNSRTTKMKLTTKLSGYPKSTKLTGSHADDPYLLQNEYEELGDLEGQQRYKGAEVEIGAAKVHG